MFTIINYRWRCFRCKERVKMDLIFKKLIHQL